MSEPHTLLDAVYLYNGGKIDECGYTNLVTNIIKVIIIIIISIIIIIIINIIHSVPECGFEGLK